MLATGARRGCVGKRPERPKNTHPNRDEAQKELEWMVEHLGAERDALRVYQCRYSPANEIHFHVGHIPGYRASYGRMPEGASNHRR